MNLQSQTGLFFLIVILLSNVFGEAKQDSGAVEGAYFMRGTIVEQTYEFPWGEEHLVRSDTITVSFVTTIRRVEEKQDTVQFFGLIGANAGKQNVLPVTCEVSDNCGYAAFEMGVFQFEYMAPGGYFTGSGRLDGDLLTISASFKYRGIGEVYELRGEKIEMSEL